jgi:HK97 family phage major capsid protein
MKSVAELRQDYLNIREQMRDLVNRAKSENRDLLPDENEQFMRMHDEQEKLSKAIEARSIISGMESEERAGFVGGIASEPEDTRTPEEKYATAFNDWLRRGSKANVKNLDILEKRGTSTITTETTGIIYGGYTVPTELDRMWTQTLKQYGGMIQAARVIRTSTGGTWNHVYTDDTSTAALLTAEASATTVQDFSFSRIQLGAYTYRSQANFSLEFIQDESVDVIGEVNSMLGIRMGRALNTAFTTGDGSSKPTGVLAASGGAPNGKTAASATAITSTEILDLIHSVDPAYRTGPNVALMMNDSTLAAIKKLQLGSNDSSPLWVPSMRDGEPGTIWGYRYVINQDFPTIATGNKSIAFGDWSYYVIREVRQPTFVRLNELYMANLTQGFLAFARYDAKLVPVGAIKVLTQA